MGYTVYPDRIKMYEDLKEIYWWNNMKKEITHFIAQCLVCQKVEAKHQKPARLLKHLNISISKWKNITIGFCNWIS